MNASWNLAPQVFRRLRSSWGLELRPRKGGLPFHCFPRFQLDVPLTSQHFGRVCFIREVLSAGIAAPFALQAIEEQRGEGETSWNTCVGVSPPSRTISEAGNVRGRRVSEKATVESLVNCPEMEPKKDCSCFRHAWGAMDGRLPKGGFKKERASVCLMTPGWFEILKPQGVARLVGQGSPSS